MKASSEYDYGRHLEEIEEDWYVREEPYGYERTARLIGNRILDICQKNGCLIANWKDISDYERK
ncbi:MAG: hypothetical protein IJ767_04410 [Bacteroidaceae bacterium]|nr:hypothetical protein [Bacteroidaceae bacterium]MBR1800721.1 hypothetical protein [Bacteroidaceae bacterium]